MKDRVPTYPGRVQLTPVPGQANTYDMVRADEPTQEGDPLCKATLLPDDVAAALGLSGNPQVKDALARLSTSVNPLQYVWEKYVVSEILGSGISLNIAGTETSTGTNTVTYGDSYSCVNKQIVINNPTTLNIGYSSGYSSSLLQNKIFTGNSLGGKFYKGTAGTVLSSNYSSNAYRVFASNVQLLTISADYIGQVSSYSSDTYPQNNMLNEYYYEYLGRPQYINARISTGSYTGTGTYGSDNPNSLTFSFVPKFLVVYGASSANLSANTAAGFFIYGAGMLQEQVYFNNGNSATQHFTLTNSDKTLQWYISANSSSYATAINQLNQSGTQYFYVAEG